MLSNFLWHGELYSLIFWKLICLPVPFTCVLRVHPLNTSRMTACTTAPLEFSVLLFLNLRLGASCCLQQCHIGPSAIHQHWVTGGSMTFFILLTCWNTTFVSEERVHYSRPSPQMFLKCYHCWYLGEVKGQPQDSVPRRTSCCVTCPPFRRRHLQLFLKSKVQKDHLWSKTSGVEVASHLKLRIRQM